MYGQWSEEGRANSRLIQNTPLMFNILERIVENSGNSEYEERLVEEIRSIIGQIY